MTHMGKIIEKVKLNFFNEKGLKKFELWKTRVVGILRLSSFL
jgi:hypothetical protein